jgi:hypothetical protein
VHQKTPSAVLALFGWTAASNATLVFLPWKLEQCSCMQCACGHQDLSMPNFGLLPFPRQAKSTTTLQDVDTTNPLTRFLRMRGPQSTLAIFVCSDVLYLS